MVVAVGGGASWLVGVAVIVVVAQITYEEVGGEVSVLRIDRLWMILRPGGEARSTALWWQLSRSGGLRWVELA